MRVIADIINPIFENSAEEVLLLIYDISLWTDEVLL